MPTWPPAPGRRTITLDMPQHQIRHLDHQAAYQGCTRAAYTRRLIVADRDARRRPALHSAATAPHDDARTITIELPVEMIAYLDQQAHASHCSRAAYIRHLVIADIRRQGPVPAAAVAG